VKIIESTNMTSRSPTDSNPEPKTSIVTVPWNPWLGIFLVAMIFILTQVLGVFLVSTYPALKHWSISTSQDWLSNNIFAQFFTELLSGILTFLCLWGFVGYYKTTFRVVGLVKAKLEDIAYALVGLVIYFPSYVAIATLVSNLIPSLNVNQTQQIGFQNPTTGLELVVAFISLVILPPIIEETIFRGFVYTSLRKKIPLVAAALITSALFALPHLFEGGKSGLFWIGGLDTFILSMVLVWLRQKTDRLYAGMGLHALKNFIAFASLYLLHLH
jgi:membrane protease YdiL (CAAX protease family)